VRVIYFFLPHLIPLIRTQGFRLLVLPCLYGPQGICLASTRNKLAPALRAFFHLTIPMVIVARFCAAIRATLVKGNLVNWLLQPLVPLVVKLNLAFNAPINSLDVLPANLTNLFHAYSLLFMLCIFVLLVILRANYHSYAVVLNSTSLFIWTQRFLPSLLFSTSIPPQSNNATPYHREHRQNDKANADVTDGSSNRQF